MSRRASFSVLAIVALGLAACSSKGTASSPAVEARMAFDRADFFAAPFPSDDLRGADGAIAIDAFPNPQQVELVREATALVTRDARGFATTGGVFFSLTGAIDGARLPSLEASVRPDATVFLVDVDPSSPEYLRRTPVSVAFEADGGPFGAPNLLSLVPLQGTPLRASTLYAAVVLRAASDPPLATAASVRAIAIGERPAAMSDAAFDSYERALAVISTTGIAAKDIAAFTAFTTDAPLDGMARVVTDMLAQPRPTPAPFTLKETFPDYCVYASTIGLPDYQRGVPPFDSAGGDWELDAAGKPIVQRVEQANLVVTLPRKPMPASGFPTTIFIRTGGGGDRPLVDRGVQGATGGPALAPGTGPARELARAGFAGVEVDGPLGGLRNTTNANEDFTIFNIFNGAALRDNIRESAAELVLLAHVLDAIAIDASACPALASAQAKLDTGTLAIMGHSMGASILPLAVAFEPRFRAVILSGAGASWIENIMFKQQPLTVRPAIELLLQYGGSGRKLTDHDPVLTLVQWATEPADAQVYAPRIVREPPPGYSARHVLMVQGIVDHYIMPPIADALSASLGLDLAGAELDTGVPEIASMMPISATFPFSGRGPVAYPVRANAGGATAVVVQAPGDGVEDGHEVIFQTAPPKYQYRCFLESFLRDGAPVVLDGAGKSDDAPCE